ncbi:MAG: chemotaxis protein CheA [Rhodoferax sp.]|jgi:two-component system chemotaxis sensor kinase CheA|nr:chemotaxis protein CheA [Rhodoferax sp.]
MDEILTAFIEDAVDLLASMESGMLTLEQGQHDPETINSIFRAVHTIKGDAGVVELEQVAAFAHVMEDALSLLRSEKIRASSPLVSLLLRCCDHIKALIADASAGNTEPDKARADCGAALAEALRAEISTQQATPGKVGQLSAAPARLPTEISSEIIPLEPLPDSGSVPSRQVRVQAEKLDQLLDLVGEMVSASAAAHLKAKKSGQTELIEANAGLVQLVESMRALSNQLRMVRIGEVFNRFKRVSRDIASAMQREIDLVIEGEDAELDKSVVEKIGDPLMHLLRNAIDHGIEAPQARLARGKPARGTVLLSACHEPGGIVIEVADDGAGLNKERILAKAIERGLVPATQKLSDQEMIELIFLPGFSTTDTVSNISGRGVGMDVVRSSIQALRGSVQVQTQAGQGSRFTLHLPLTMAIIDGFLVSLGKTYFVIALNMVFECLELTDHSATSGYLDLRGHALPLVLLRQRFGERSPRPHKEHVVVVKSGQQQVGIVVDSLHGEMQAVIKPLPALFHHLPGIAGSTILGTGAVALILDVPSLMASISSPDQR